MGSGRNKKRKLSDSTDIASHEAPVTPSLPVQPLTPSYSSSADANEEAGLSQSHSLVASRSLVINDGHFNQVRGHQASLVINVNQHMPSGSPSNEADYINPTPSGRSTHTSIMSTSYQSDPSSENRTQIEPDRERSQVSSQSQEITLQKSNDIYERHLTLKGRGFPLWIPDPNQVLHTDYRRTGVRIGDVGIITHSGGFSFLFNICLRRDDPVNPRTLPEHFAPISPPIEATDIEKFLVFKNGSHLASASIKRSQTSAAVSGIVFESSASEGAILTMPRGARSEDLGNFARFREYAAANVADWYKFVNGPRGREAKNGDVRLVVGFDKTTSWGIATFANQTQQNNCRLKFGPSEGVGLRTPATYVWEYSGVAEVRAGPDLDENDDLRIGSDPPDVQFENQCLFVRTLNVTLTDDVWTDIHSGLGSVHVNPRSDSNRPYSTNPGTGNGNSSSSLPSQGAQSGTQRTTSPLHGLQDTEVSSGDNPSMFISGPLQSLTAHPSKALNDILLEKVPTAKMAITHDDDWSSVITQYDALPNPHDFIEHILASRNVCEENGVVFLQPKEVAKDMSEGSASGDLVQGSSTLPCTFHLQLFNSPLTMDLAEIKTPFNKDNLNVFMAFIFSLQISPYRNAFPTLPRFFLIDGAQDLISFNISQYSGAFELQKPLDPETPISTLFSMTHDTVKEMSELFLSAGLLEDMQDPLRYDFDDKAVYQFTLLGFHSLNRFLHENSYLQKFLKSSLGVMSTQTAALPLSVFASMGIQYFVKVGLMEDAQNILSTTFNDSKVYQFTPMYFASAVNFPSGRHTKGDDSIITLPQSSGVKEEPMIFDNGAMESTSVSYDDMEVIKDHPSPEPMMMDLFDEMKFDVDGVIGNSIGVNDINTGGGVANVDGSGVILKLMGAPFVPSFGSGGNSELATLTLSEKSSRVGDDRPPRARSTLGTGTQKKMTLAIGNRRGQGKYIITACDFCLQRKIKCDGIKPVCQQCQHRLIQCKWTARKPRTESHFLPIQKQAENLRKRAAEFRQYANHLESLVEGCQQHHQQHRSLDFRASRPSDSDGLLDGLEPEFDLIDHGPVDENDPASIPIHIRPQSVQLEHFTQPSRFSALSENPENTYILLVEGVESPSHYNPAFDWSRYLPSDVPLDRRSHDRALDLLFKFFTPWCLRIVPALFLRDMYRVLSVPPTETPLKTSHYSPMLHNALVALALAFLDDPNFSDLEVRQYFANAGKNFIEAECRKPNQSVVHALSLLASFHSAQGDKTLGYMYFGMSAHMSHARLSVDRSEWVKLGFMDEADKLDRDWANWTIFTQDVCWSIHVGRDFCVPAPVEGKISMPHVDPDLDNISWFDPPVGIAPQPSNLTKTFEATCRLLIIARRIMNVVIEPNKTRRRPADLESLIIDIDVQLNKWKDSLTPELEITARSLPTATPHKLMLHLAYWWLLILLHRPFFPSKSRPIHSTDREIDHVKLCRRAAEHIMELLLTWRNLYTLRYCPVTLIQIVFSAGTVYLLTARQAMSGVRVAQIGLQHSLNQEALVRQYLQEIGISWKSAINLSGILRSLIQEQLRPLLEQRNKTVAAGLHISGDSGADEEDISSKSSSSSSKSLHTRRYQATQPSTISSGSVQSILPYDFQLLSSPPSKNHYLDSHLGMLSGQTLSEAPFIGSFSEGDILSSYFPNSPYESSPSSLIEHVLSSSHDDNHSVDIDNISWEQY